MIKTEATDGLSVPQGIHYNNNIWYSWLKLERREFFFVSARNIDFITVRTHVRLSVSFLTVLNLLALPTQKEIGDENQLRFLFDSLTGQKGEVVTTELIFLRQDNVNRHIFLSNIMAQINLFLFRNIRPEFTDQQPNILRHWTLELKLSSGLKPTNILSQL